MTKLVLFYQTKKQCFEQIERWSNSSADEYIEAPSQSSQTLISCILNETSNGWVLNLFGINKADTSPLQTKTSANLPAVGFNFSDGYRPQSNPPNSVRSRKTLRISRLHIQLYVWTRSHCSTKGHLSAQEKQTCLWDTASPLLTHKTTRFYMLTNAREVSFLPHYKRPPSIFQGHHPQRTGYPLP